MMKLTEMAIRFAGYLRNEKGQSMVEYALVLGLVVLVGIAALTNIGGSVKNILTNISTSLANH